MKAVVCTAYGAPEVLKLQALAAPTPADHQVRIRVFATTVTAACGMMRRADSVMASYEEAASMIDGPTTALYFLRDRARIRAGDGVLA